MVGTEYSYKWIHVLGEFNNQDEHILLQKVGIPYEDFSKVINTFCIKPGWMGYQVAK